MSEDKRRVCGTCAWWKRYEQRYRNGQMRTAGDCCYDPAEVQKGSGEWCRHHSFTTGWEEEPKKKDSDYVEFIQRLRKGPAVEELEEEDRKGNDLGESIDHDSERQVSMAQIKVLKAKIEQARWLIDQAVLWVRTRAITAEGQYWRARRDKWLAENGQDE